ncbi:MAG: glucosaminidase domain-containing protein [Kangiellaceae bacterium]|nr:glucosaminidase domain-containing protein [Kangiellaceae bacterium]
MNNFSINKKDLRENLIKKERVGLIIVSVLVFILLSLHISNHEWQEIKPKQVNLPLVRLPDFNVYTEVGEKKQAFFEFLRPFIRQENLKLRYKKAFLDKLEEDLQNDRYHNQATIQKIKRMAKSYRVTETSLPQIVEALRIKVDEIPESLVLVQAANESAWGTSRFAVQANNLFGQWCFDKGCGLVPSGRGASDRHEVRMFESPQASVTSYMKNLNSHPAYKELRELRAGLRASNRNVTGTLLAASLQNYSERREAYTEELIAMIRHNKLE